MKMRQLKSFDKLNKIPYFLDVYKLWNLARPRQVLLVDDHYYEGWTRSKVDKLSGRIYNYLLQQGIGKNDFVMICLPRGVLPIIAMIGVWKAGAAFVTVEDDYAPERIEFIKNDCGCKLTIDLELFEDIAENVKYKRGYVRADDHDACFAVYTSGSTGRPKGVLHEYGNIKLNAALQNIDVPMGARAALIAPLNFIASIKMVLGLLYAPATLYVVPYSIVKNPRKLADYFLESKIGITFLSPSLIRAVGNNFGPYLKTIETGSEPANGIFLDGVQLVNNYAMSEGAFTVCQFEIDKAYDVCPVGKPASPALKVSLLDENGNEVPQGEQGEICFPNPFMRGYINLPEQTAEVLHDGLYHSGDLGYADENGNIVLVGRANDMIKINGNRIEPAEIEAAFKQVTGKDWCAAKGFEAPDQSYVCAYYTGDLDMSEDDIRKGMEEHVPYYMIPSFFVRIEHVPLLENGKLARKELPDPRATLKRKEYVAPRDELELTLCKAFEEVLGLENVGITEDFYDLGGSSVKAMQILGVTELDSLSAIDLYNGRTVEQIARVYREKTEGLENISEEDKEMRARQVPHEVPPVQQSVIDYQLFTPKAPMWLYPYLLSFGEDADPQRLLEAARKVQRHHPIFGTIFEFNDAADLQQRYDESALEPIELEVMTDDEFEELRESQIENFRLLGQPMIKVRVIKTDSDLYLMVIFHHIIMDGSSIQLVFKSFAAAYTDQPLELDTYYSYLEDAENMRHTRAYREAAEFYNKKYEGIDWNDIIYPDRYEPGNYYGERVIETGLTATNIAAMEERCGVSRNGFIIALATLALARINGKHDVMTLFAFHNRVDVRTQHAAGFLASLLPLGVKLDEVDTLADLYDVINTESTNSIAHSTYDWVTLRDNPFLSDSIAVVYETADITDMSALDALDAVMEPLSAKSQAALRRNMLQTLEMGDSITTTLVYMATIYSDELIDRFDKCYADLAKTLIAVEDPKSVKIADLLA